MTEKQQLTILIIDNNALNLRLIESILTQVRYSIRLATGGKEGQSLSLGTPPRTDPIFLDVFMPNENGFTTLASQEKPVADDDIVIMEV